MSQIVLRRHKLHHIPDLKVHPEVLHARFPGTCSTTRCTARCCATGVWLDSAEHELILGNAALVQAEMDPLQEKNPDRWFDGHWWGHPDFPSGRGISTAASNGACVFLSADRRCVLQLASPAGKPLKPFFCTSFPLTICDGELCLDDVSDPACCLHDPDGSQTVLELCAHELEHLIGAEGVKELRDLADGVTE
jgi:hypothetical protein